MDVSMQKISVITVVFNGTQELQATIDSVVAQDYPYIEYVVIDGGSNDGTIDLIKLNQEKLSHWISEPDNGIYDAMNKGCKIASGQYVIFMNAGDTFYSNDALSSIMHRLNNVSVDNLPDIIMASYNVHSAIRRNGVRRCGRLVDLWKGMITSHQSILFKHDGSVFYNLKYRLTADYDLIVKKYNEGASFDIYNDIILSNYSGGGVSDVNQADVYRSYYEISKSLKSNKIKKFFYFSFMYIRSLFRDLACHLLR